MICILFSDVERACVRQGAAGKQIGKQELGSSV